MITKSIAQFGFFFQIQIYQIFRELIIHSEACFSSSKYYYKTSQLIEHRRELSNQTVVDS